MAVKSRSVGIRPDLRVHFNPKVDYEVLLDKFKEEFTRRFEQHSVSPQTNLEGYEEIATLGAGSFGKVKLIKDKQSSKYFAAKFLLKDQIVKTKQVLHTINEKRVLHSISFPFMITLIFSSKDNDFLYLGLPFINGGELFTYHRRYKLIIAFRCTVKPFINGQLPHQHTRLLIVQCLVIRGGFKCVHLWEVSGYEWFHCIRQNFFTISLRRVRKFNEKQARFYAAQVFMALEYLHYMQLLYRDLKPENILISSNGYIKVTDFGFAKKVETRTLTLCGTPEYLAPEIIQSKPYGVSVDWWAFGVLIYEFVAGSSPFAPFNRDVMVMYSKICDGEYKMPNFFSPPFKDLVANLLQTDVTKRFGNLINGNKDIKDHEWFKPVDWYAILNQDINPPYVPTVTHLEDLQHFDRFQEKIFVKSKVNKHAEVFADF